MTIKYDKHEEEWREILANPERSKVAESWLRGDTLDAWRHGRMRRPLHPILETNEDASWLTIGDGRFGTDANFLLSNGAKDVHCTDISDALLQIGNKKGFISTFSAENAEALSFSDNSFDYVYCKEAYHHFPRPYLALYEMFRVARKAVILTEPMDQNVDLSLYQRLRRMLGKNRGDHRFESVGNYIYSISEREIEKFLLGMHYTTVAYSRLNDAYLPGVEFAPQEPLLSEHKAIRRKIRMKIWLLDSLCKVRFMKPGILSAALFKSAPSEKLLEVMRNAGWEIHKLPLNPYLD